MRTQAVTPETVIAAAGQLSKTDGELTFQRRVACTPAAQGEAATSSTPTLEPATVTHFLIAGRASALTPGTVIAPGISITSANMISVAAGAEAQFNDQIVDGDVTLSADDRLQVGDVEVRFITVEP